jgi:lactoylglutathione lyase
MLSRDCIVPDFISLSVIFLRVTYIETLMMAAVPTRRALHFVFKIGDRKRTANFYREVLGMKFLRHEEFEKGCEATCNGPYDGKWSKSMVGYGPEDSHFVVELTYNYGIGSYAMGDDFHGITIQSKEVFEKASAVAPADLIISRANAGRLTLKSPDGHLFHLIDAPAPGTDPVVSVALASSKMQNSIEFWHGVLDMKVFAKEEKRVTLGFAENMCKLELIDIGTPVDHAKAFGRVAFSCPRKELPGIQEKVEQKIGIPHVKTPLISLDTPGKATVEVVILSDPDDHEICFVGDEAFRELSLVDPNADALLEQGLSNDKSTEWYERKGKQKPTA